MNDNELIKELKALMADCFSAKYKIITLINQLTTSTARICAGKLLSKQKNSCLQPIKIALLSSCNIDELQALAVTALFERQFTATTFVAEFNQYYIQLIDPNSNFYQFDANIAALLLDEDVIFNELSIPYTLASLGAGITSFSQRLQQFLTRFTQTSTAYLVMPTIALSFEKYGYFLGYKDKAKLTALWNELNNTILQASNEYPQIIVLDTSILLQKIVKKHIRDLRLLHYAGRQFHAELLDEIAKEIASVAASSFGMIKKALVVDLDETLWGGLIGEDGLSGIDLGATPEGKAYVDLQHYIKQLSSQGIMLAINSKNDLENVNEVFNHHPDMFLKKDDFLVKKINWEPKSANLKTIAQTLNISIDSLVFMDDSAHECHLVNELMPEVAVLHVTQPPFNSIEKIQESRLLNMIEVTAQDLSRHASISLEIEKQTFLATHASLDDYLSALQIQVRLVKPDAITLPRIAQLHARTNQFNMTTRRYTAQQLIEMQQLNHLIFGICSCDRFGDNGIVGAIVLERSLKNEAPIMTIKNFLLSCRFFSRGIEIKALDEVKAISKSMGILKLQGEYIPSKKNLNVQNFYSDNGFNRLPSDDVAIFQYELIIV